MGSNHHHHRHRNHKRQVLAIIGWILLFCLIGFGLYMFTGLIGLCVFGGVALIVLIYQILRVQRQRRIQAKIDKLNARFKDKNLSREENFRISDEIEELYKQMP